MVSILSKIDINFCDRFGSSANFIARYVFWASISYGIKGIGAPSRSRLGDPTFAAAIAGFGVWSVDILGLTFSLLCRGLRARHF